MVRKKLKEVEMLDVEEEEEEQKVIPRKKNKSSEEYELTEVVTQTGKAYKLPNGDVVQLDELIIDMAKRIHNIERSVA